MDAAEPGSFRMAYGPTEWPVIGSLGPMLRDPLAFLLDVSRRYGDVVRFHLPGQRILLLNHPGAIEEVLLTHNQRLIKDEFTRRLSIVVGNGLLTSEGAFWKQNRRLAQPAFHHHRVRGYADVIVRHAREAAQALASAGVRDVHAEMMRLTLVIVAECLFGARLGPVATDIGDLLDVFTERFSGASAALPQWVPSPANRKVRRARARFDAIVYSLIAERRGGEDRGDLLSMLLAAKGDTGEGMSDGQLRDEIATLLLAGHETTALTLTFALHVLARNDGVQAALAEEVLHVLGDRPATFADVAALPFTEAVVRETMRLYPPAWAIGREATEPFRIAGVEIDKGTQLWVAQWVVHRDPRYFAEPERFLPERWLDGLAGRLPRFAYFPFGGGPRVCIGNAFAMMEAVLVLATLIQTTRYESTESKPLELYPSVTLRPKGAVNLRISPRTAHR